MVYQNWDQFLELMGIIKNLEEQVRTIHIREPALIQIQDFIDRPFQLQTITRKSKYESRMEDFDIDKSLITLLEKVFYKPYARSDLDY
jgi:hypothetical protein